MFCFKYQLLSPFAVELKHVLCHEDNKQRFQEFSSCFTQKQNPQLMAHFVKCLNAFWDSLTFLITEPGLYLTQCTVELCFIPVMGGSNVSLTGDHEKLRVSEVILSLYQKLGVTGINLCSSDVGLLKGHLSEPTRLLLIFVLLYYTIPTHPFIDLGKSQKISHFLYGK